MDLTEKERLIARQFIGKTPWFMITWWAINLFIWFSLWPLALTGQIPLYITFLISLICTLLSYLPSHEAQHENSARKNSSLFWFNELIGYLNYKRDASNMYTLMEKPKYSDKTNKTLEYKSWF